MDIMYRSKRLSNNNHDLQELESQGIVVIEADWYWTRKNNASLKFILLLIKLQLLNRNKDIDYF